MECKFCKRVAKNKISFISHERLCPQNPNRVYKNGMTGKKGSNQYIKARSLGLSDPICSIETRKKIGLAFKGRKHLDSTKEKLSILKKQYLDENPDKVPFKLNHSSRISYPEKIFLELLKDLNLKFQYQVKRYTLDFANIDNKKYLEIDGEQHYTEKYILRDSSRKEYLQNLGWQEKRIRWKEFYFMSQEEKDATIQDIIKWFSST